MANIRVFPRVMYHPAEGSRVVRSEAEELSLGEPWSDTPAIEEEENPLSIDERFDAIEARFAEIETAIADLRSSRRKAK